jgi:hypothetical protein
MPTTGLYKKIKKMTRQEEILQGQIVMWFNNNHLKQHKCLFAVDNNSKNKIAGAMAKAKGVKSGISDLVLVCPNAKTVYVELKTDSGKQDPEQKIFQEQIEAFGHIYILCRSLDQFKEIVKTHFY